MNPPLVGQGDDAPLLEPSRRYRREGLRRTFLAAAMVALSTWSRSGLADTESGEQARDSLLVPRERRRCLLDHLLQFHELLRHSGHAARMDVLGRSDWVRQFFERFGARR
jgi:hypothetical protein